MKTLREYVNETLATVHEQNFKGRVDVEFDLFVSPDKNGHLLVTDSGSRIKFTITI